jgi:hypothetical protein
MPAHRYHPWRILRGLPHITVRWSGAVARGRVDGHTITLHPLLTQAERRVTLAHELVHLERGPAPDHLGPREERLVEEIAARRLVELEDLADAVLWHDGAAHDGMADELWIDRAMLLARIRSLTDVERAYIESRVEQQGRTA